MIFLGEIIALCASLFWTTAAISGEVASKRIGAISVNIWTMLIAFILLNITLLCLTGNPFPQYLDFKSLIWIIGSGLLCFVVCNYFLYNAYILIGSRFSQLFMTLISPSAAVTGWIILDERLTLQECIGIAVTLAGIMLTLLGNKPSGNDKKDQPKMSLKGIVYAIISSLAQGIGLVLGKVGMMYYHENMPHELTNLSNLIPLSSSYIRILTGLAGFIIIIFLIKESGKFKQTMHDKKGVLTAMFTGAAGPFLGATCALVAMRYSKAGIAATLVELTPILIIVPAHYIFKQKIYFLQVIGTVISVFGVSLFFIKF